MTVEFTVTVKAGYYNVYDLLDLYVIDNRAEKGDSCREAVPVKEYRESHGITVDTTTLKGIALQGDIPSPLNAPSGCPFRTRCPYADKKCAEAMPAFSEVAPNHYVACHRVNGGKAADSQ